MWRLKFSLKFESHQGRTNMKFSVLTFMLVIVSVKCISLLSDLRQRVFYGYDKKVSPGLEVKIFLKMSLLDVKVSAESQEIETWCHLQLAWNESRLSWDPTRYENITKLIADIDDIWYPDVGPVNGKQINFPYNHLQSKVKLSFSGEIVSNNPVTLTTFCPLNITDWPWGIQNCSIILSSLSSSKDMLHIEVGNFTTDDFLNKRVDILSTNIFVQEGTYDDDIDVYQKIIFTLGFRQNTIFNGKSFITSGNYEDECDSSEEEE